MSSEILKSSSQLEYEIKQSKSELYSLQRNWKQKKNTSLFKLLSLRSAKKELDAVMAETEKGYQAYCLLLNSISHLASFDTTKLNDSLQEFENVDMEFVVSITSILHEAVNISNNTGGVETNRVLRQREKYNTELNYIHQKSKDIYAAMKEERKTVEAYSTHLSHIIREKQIQIEYQNKLFGKGL